MTQAFEDRAKKLNKIHLISTITLAIIELFFMYCTNHADYKEDTVMTVVKSVAIIYMIANILLLWWKYDNTLKNHEMSADVKEEQLMKWSNIKILVWFTNVVICILLYSFDGDASMFQLGFLAILIYAFFGHINLKDIKKEEQSVDENKPQNE